MPSHIGFESAIGKDCWNLSRSILAENSPYYETGVRLSLNSANGKWYAAAMLLNGWQRMARATGIQSAHFGDSNNVQTQRRRNAQLEYVFG
nr:outer membrane beta-barrel protein [Haliscomenobacter sp.]